MKNILIVLLLSLTPLISYTLSRPTSTDLISTATLHSTEYDEMTEEQSQVVNSVTLYGTVFKEKNQIFIVMPFTFIYSSSLHTNIQHNIYNGGQQIPPYLNLIAIDAIHNLAVLTPNLHLMNPQFFSNAFPFSDLDTTSHYNSIKREIRVLQLYNNHNLSSINGITVPYEQWQSSDIIDVHTENMRPSTSEGSRPVFNSETNKVIGVQNNMLLNTIQVVSANVVYRLLQQAQDKPINCPLPWTNCINTLLESLHNTQDPTVQFQFSQIYHYITQMHIYINKQLNRQVLSTTQKYTTSVQFLKKSAKQGYPPAMHVYAIYLLRLSLINAQKSLGLFRQAVQHMYAPSLFYIGKELVLYTTEKAKYTLFYWALGGKIDPNIKEEKRKEGLQLIQHASSLNYPPAKDYLKNQAQQ